MELQNVGAADRNQINANTGQVLGNKVKKLSP